MSKEPLHPLHIPDDTSDTGVFGWMLESIVRSYALRLAGIIALLGATVAARRVDAPTAPRIARVVLGVLAFPRLLERPRRVRAAHVAAQVLAAQPAVGAHRGFGAGVRRVARRRRTPGLRRRAPRTFGEGVLRAHSGDTDEGDPWRVR